MRARTKGTEMEQQLTYFGSVLKTAKGPQKRGIDIVEDLSKATPEDLLYRKYLQVIPRDELLPMYKELLAVMLDARNDKEAARALGIIYHLMIDESVLSTDDFGMYPPERRKEMRDKEPRFLDFVEGWYFTLPLYKLDWEGGDRRLTVKSLFPLVRRYIVASLLHIWEGSWMKDVRSPEYAKEGYVDELSRRAFDLLQDFYVPEAFLKRAVVVNKCHENITSFRQPFYARGSFAFPNEEEKQVEDGLRRCEPNDLVTYYQFLKRREAPWNWKMPEEWLNLFKIGYVKKGGDIMPPE